MLAALANKYKSIIDQNSFKQSKNMVVMHAAIGYRDDLNKLKKLYLSLPVVEPHICVDIGQTNDVLVGVQNHLTKNIYFAVRTKN